MSVELIKEPYSIIVYPKAQTALMYYDKGWTIIRVHAADYREYMFDWYKVPGPESRKLILFLAKKYNIEWIKNAKIEKIADSDTLRIFTDKNWLEISLTNERTQSSIKIDDSRTDRFFIKNELRKLKFYVFDIDPGAGKRPVDSNWQQSTRDKGSSRQDLEKYFGDTTEDYNMGVLLGKESDLVGLDYDKSDWLAAIFPPERRVLENALRDQRIPGRGHAYWKWTDKLTTFKHLEFGIEFYCGGHQFVIPPSRHRDGQDYKWILPDGEKIESFKHQELPAYAIESLKLFDSFATKTKKCAACFRWVIHQSKDSMHHCAGRRLMLAIATELKANGVTLDEMRIYARRVYGTDYNPVRTEEEWRNVDPKKTWRCETLRQEFPEFARHCADCQRMDSAVTVIDPVSSAKAREIMETGKPIDFILDTWNGIHAGDRPLGHVLMCSAVCSSIENSDGLPVNFNGEPGGGKSHGCRVMLHLIPKKYWIRRKVSDKALFYSDSIKPDMIFFSDDAQMSDDFKVIFKTSVSDFQESIELETVNIQRKGELLKAPPRLTWWLTAVTDIGNEEVERRCLKISVEKTEASKKAISDRLQRRKSRNEAKYPESPEISICRAIFEDLKKTKETVVFNFKLQFPGAMTIDTQALFYEILMATALFNKYQRMRDEDGAIIANREDFNATAETFTAIADTQGNKLTKAESQVANYLHEVRTASSESIQEYFHRSHTWVWQIMNGRKGEGGLLSKMPNIVKDDVTTKDDTESIRGLRYRFVGDWNPFACYEKVAIIEE